MPVVESLPRFIAVVPAAGVGARVGADIPKQYISIDGKTVLEHTLERLLLSDVFDQIVVAVGADDQNWQTISLLKNPKISIVEGGVERSDSVLAALVSIDAQPNDWILVHDVARPCIQPATIKHLISSLRDHQVGGLLAVPVSDTVKRVDNANTITATVDRSELWRAQTPQMFPYALLRDALTQGLAQQLAITDEASAIELMGLKPKVVEGLQSNIKITRPEDIALAAYYLKQTTPIDK